MNDRYTEWIKEHEANHRIDYRCQSSSQDMVEVFPELRRVRGYIKVVNVNHSRFVLTEEECTSNTPHWWCETQDGEVIDPTAGQFKTIIGYDEYSEEKHGPLPIGKCMNCGGYVYTSEFNSLCCEECEVSFTAYMSEEATL